jgi:hypothetical protein
MHALNRGMAEKHRHAIASKTPLDTNSPFSGVDGEVVNLDFKTSKFKIRQNA